MRFIMRVIMRVVFLLNFLLFSHLVLLTNQTKISDQNKGQEFIKDAEKRIGEHNNRLALVQLDYITDINNETEKRVLEEKTKYNVFMRELWKNASQYDFENFKDYKTRRQFEKLKGFLGEYALDHLDYEYYSNILNEMENNFNNASACVNQICFEELQDLSNFMAESDDYDQLKEAWVSWRDSAGKPVRELYKEYVRLGNKAAVKNGFKTLDDLWLFPWETPDFKEQMETLWQEMEDLYKKLHTFVRMKLKERYGNKMPADGTLPAHLLGDIWGSDWQSIIDWVLPFPNKKSVDISDTLKEQNWTAVKMFELSDKFFRDLGLSGLPETFWNFSMIVKPPNKKVNCHPSAITFYNNKDFAIVMCTEIEMSELLTIHHEMGHIQYFLQYRDQPLLFRESANPGFHEAIGDLLALSVSTPRHLHKLGLYNPLVDDHETTLNYQMFKALDKIVFLPWAYIMDLYRWDVFSGKTSSDHLNKRWWDLRLKYQGISPPIKRSEEDFDAGAVYQISADDEYIRYFVSNVIQFQFHKSLCSIAEPNVPLYKCDIDGNKEVGKKLSEALKLGSSKPWPDVMQILTGSRNMSAKPLIEYFDPLLKYLENEIKNETIGWKSDVNLYMNDTNNNDFENSALISRMETIERNNEILGNRITKLEAILTEQQKVIQFLTSNHTFDNFI